MEHNEMEEKSQDVTWEGISLLQLLLLHNYIRTLVPLNTDNVNQTWVNSLEDRDK